MTVTYKNNVSSDLSFIQSLSTAALDALSKAASQITVDDYSSPADFSRPSAQIWTPLFIMTQTLELTPGNISRQLLRTWHRSQKKNQTKKHKKSKKDKKSQKKSKSSSGKKSRKNGKKSKSYAKEAKRIEKPLLKGLGKKPSASGFCQARKKLTDHPFENAFQIFTEKLLQDEKFQKLDTVIIAIDGMNLPVPVNKDEPQNLVSTRGKLRGGMHNNCALLLNYHPLFLGSILQSFDEKNECSAALELIKRIEAQFPDKKLIFIADRGYFNWPMVHYCCTHGIYFILRMKQNVYANQTGNQNLDCCGDLTLQQDLTNSQKKQVLEDLLNPCFVSKNSFDLTNIPESERSIRLRYLTTALDEESASALADLDAESEDGAQSSYSHTYLCTNIPEEEMNAQEINDNYFKRWLIEISYGLLKHKVGLIRLHSKSENKIRQEIWMALLRFNLCTMIKACLTPLIEENLSRRAKKKRGPKTCRLIMPKRKTYIEADKVPKSGNGYIRKVSFSTVSRCLADYMYDNICLDDFLNEVIDNLVYTKPGRHEARGNTIHHFHGFQWYF